VLKVFWYAQLKKWFCNLKVNMNTRINPNKTEWERLCARPTLNLENLEATIQTVFEQVKSNGDQALIELTKRFDGASLSELEVSSEEWETYIKEVDENLKEAIQTAANNIETFHRSQQLLEEVVETSQGVTCWRKSVAIQRVGLYIPGGSAPLFSTVLMLGIPASIANCPTRILCTPPDSFGQINPAIAYAARLAGVQRIFKVGGAQAIAAMSIGTETIPKVDKLFGPGNQYVTAAKVYAQRLGVAIDMPAGPSEVLVASDDSIPASFVAADLLAQAEHGPDSQVVFLSDSETYLEEVMDQLKLQLLALPRVEIAVEALNNSLMVVLDSENWSGFINTYAPEHLIVMGNYEQQVVNEIINAGSVFIGRFSAESFGDYASGTNHTLPTAGFAKAYSGVSLDSFVKKITYQQVSKEGLINLGGTVVTMAMAEGLQGHAAAVEIRLKQVEDSGDLRDSEFQSEFSLETTIRPEFLEITPYSSAREEYEGEAAVFLDANENGLLQNYNRYPDPLQRELKRVVAAIKGFSVEHLFLGNGSDEVLDLILRLVGRPRVDQVAFLNPSYGMYHVLANINQLKPVPIQLDATFEIEPSKVLREANGCKVLILCNPNNPTGKLITRKAMLEIISNFRGVVVVDEAYIDFCPSESVHDLILEYPNLIVTQTLSKSFGMAGLRIGMAIANTDWIHALNRIKPPYNLSTIVQDKAMEILQKNNWKDIVQTIVSERSRVKSALEICDNVIQVIDSEANFLLFQVTDANAVYAKLANEGIVVRNRTNQAGCQNMLRVSIGSPEENNRFIQSLKRL
jgi:histidinol dehydrogenase